MEKFECVKCYDEVEITGNDTEVNDLMIEHELCKDCFEDTFKYCGECGEYHEVEELTHALKNDEDVWVCDSCLDDYFYCNECDTWYYDSNYYDETVITDMDNKETKVVCYECAGNMDYVFYCEYHERYEESSYKYTIENYGIVCDNAYEFGNFGTCEQCEHSFEYDDLYYDDDSGNYYCEECYHDNVTTKGKIKGYHNHKGDYEDNKKILSDNPDVVTFGFELEVEAGNLEPGEMSERLDNTMGDFTVYEEDGSLHNGFEIISNPFDLDYLKEDGADLIENMCLELKENKYKSHDTSTCGLHVHVGRSGLGNDHYTIEETIKKVNILVEYFKEELTVFSRRDADKLKRWANFSTELPKEELTLKQIRDDIAMKNGRYSALNVQGRDTIEFRLFRGTIKFSTIMASLELVNNFVHYAKNNDINDLNLDFYKVATYKEDNYITDYLINRKIIKKELA